MRQYIHIARKAWSCWSGALAMPVPAAPTGLLQAETLNEAQLHLTAASNMALAHLDALAQAASKVKLNVGNAETGLPPKDPLRVPTNWWSAQDQAFFNTVVMTLPALLCG